MALAEGWPVLGTTIVVGTTFGVVARQAGLTPLETAAMSLFVFAGAAQFAMVQLITVGAAVPVVIVTVLFLNLRHLLMAASLRSRFAELPSARRLAAAFFLTDESFAMATGYFRRGGGTPDVLRHLRGRPLRPLECRHAGRRRARERDRRAAPSRG